MDFLPTEDQVALRAGVAEVLARELPPARLAERPPPDVWPRLHDLGVFDLRRPAAEGGLGLGLTEAALVFEELGRAAVPGPLVGTHLAAGHGDGPVTLLDPRRSPAVLTHLATSRAVAVLEDDGPRLVPAADVVAEEVAVPLDPLSPVHEVRSPPDGRRLGGPDLAREWRLAGTVLTAALQVGLAARMTELAVAYAGQREQFGRPVGSFQAVQHLCADMLVRTELARAAVHAAAVTCDGRGAGEATVLAAGAKLLADEAASANGRSCVQVHGGMGFTWEMPVHFLLKRAWVHATEFGTAEEHAEHVAQQL